MQTIEWLTLTLVLITGFYAWATFKILRANEAMVASIKAQNDAAMRPYVTVSSHLRTGTQLVYLLIKNAGKTQALNLTLSLSKDFYQMGERKEGRNLRSFSAFTSQIDSLAPGAQLLFLLGSGPSLFGPSNNDELSPLVFEVTSSYESVTGRIVEKSKVDLRPFNNSDIFHEPIVEELKKVRETLRELQQIRRSIEKFRESDQGGL